jgi:protein Mpv17
MTSSMPTPWSVVLLVASLAPLEATPLRALVKAGGQYAAFSTSHPHIAAAATAGSIICLADLTCQNVLERDQSGVDVRRTAALTLFGTWHYGVPAKSLYLLYDRLLGSAPTLANAAQKMLLDVYVHTPLLLIPSFYLITCLVRGRTLRQTLAQLRKEWWTASFGSILFWTPCNAAAEHRTVVGALLRDERGRRRWGWRRSRWW